MATLIQSSNFRILNYGAIRGYNFFFVFASGATLVINSQVAGRITEIHEGMRMQNRSQNFANIVSGSIL